MASCLEYDPDKKGLGDRKAWGRQLLSALEERDGDRNPQPKTGEILDPLSPDEEAIFDELMKNLGDSSEEGS